MTSRQRVEALAGHLLDFAGVDRPPVPLALVHAVADVRIMYVDWRYHQGFTYAHRGAFYIAVNGNDSEAERRFTIFHELFHVIEHVQPAFRLLAPAGWQAELLADHFARSLLLSDRWFAGCARACGGDVNALAAECGVSPALVATKLASKRA